MNTMTLNGPEGIAVRLGVDAKLSEHRRRHLVTREMLAAQRDVGLRDIRLRREDSGVFGHRSHLRSVIDGEHLPLVIKAASYGDATVVAIADLHVPLGLDLRPSVSDEAELAEIRRHSHLFPETRDEELHDHWTRVHAVREADGRGSLIQLERILLDPESSTGWLRDRRVHYQIADLSHGDWTITLAYAKGPR
ncbi:hypothetical protein ACWGJP_08345 [Microbacterium sp. NPDC055903]